jgi:fructokinase
VIVVGGEALVDLVINTQGQVVAKLGGGPFNSARAAARLGSPVAFLGSLSRDRFGAGLRQMLLDDGVSDALVQFTELPTTLAAAELDADGSASYRFYITDTSAPWMHPVTLPADCSVLHLGTLGMVLEPMATVLEDTVHHVHDDTLVFLDPNCRPRVIRNREGYLERLELLAGRADMVKVSTDDLEFLNPTDVSGAIATLLEQGARCVLHTDGGSSVVVYVGKQSVQIPVPSVKVADTIGAGDSFGGAMVAWWQQAGFGRAEVDDIDLVAKAAADAVKVAAINCTRVGAQPPTRAEMQSDWNPGR